MLSNYNETHSRAASAIQSWYKKIKKESSECNLHNDYSEMAHERINRILGYLNSVQQDTLSVKQESVRESFSVFPQAEPTNMFDGVKSRIMSLQLESQEKQKTIQMLKDELESARSIFKQEKDSVEKEYKSKMHLQKKSYETIVKRHLGFIDKLLKEKEEMATKYDKICSELNEMEQKYKQKLKDSESHHQKDLKFQKDQWNALEKVKREKWIQEKSQLIRDQTIKGLEPEIQRMLAKHSQELKAQKEKLKYEQSNERTNWEQQKSIEIDQLKQKMELERQKLLDDERSILKTRMQQQLEKQELEFQQYKRNINHDFEEQKQYMRSSFVEEKKLIEISFNEKIDRLSRQFDDYKQKSAQELKQLEQNHAEQMQMVELKARKQFQDWKSEYEKNQDAVIEKRELKLKEQLLEERDREIEKIIDKLAQEQISGYSKSNSEKEISDLKSQLVNSIEKNQQFTARLNELNLENTQIKSKLDHLLRQIGQKDEIIEHQQSELNALKVIEDELKQRIEKQFIDEKNSLKVRVKTLTNQNQELNTEVDRMKQLVEREKKRLEQEKNDSLTFVEQRVRQTVALKDEIITTLRSQLQDSVIKSSQLEGLIDKQRKELLNV